MFTPLMDACTAAYCPMMARRDRTFSAMAETDPELALSWGERPASRPISMTAFAGVCALILGLPIALGALGI